MEPISVHVVPHGDGDWYIRINNIYTDKEQALAAARDASRQLDAELYEHNLDGQIAERDSHGNDPPTSPG